MKITKQEEKLKLCADYADYLKIIYHFGNKIMLQKQLFQYAKLFTLVGSEAIFTQVIKYLEEKGIIKREAFVPYGLKTQHKVIILTKFAIGYLENKKPDTVNGVAKNKNDERAMLSVFRNEYIIEVLIPFLKLRNIDINLESIIRVLNRRKNSLLFERNQGLAYLKTLREIDNKKFNYTFVESEIERLIRTAKKRQLGIQKALENRKNTPAKLSQGSQKPTLETGSQDPILEAQFRKKKYKTKDEKIESYNIDSLFSSFMASEFLKLDNDFILQLNVFDISDSTNFYRLATQIACAYIYFKNFALHDEMLKVNVTIYTASSGSLEKIKKEANRFVEVQGLTEKRTLLNATLRNWKVDDNMQTFIKFEYRTLEITEKYLDGKKYKNLLQNQKSNSPKKDTLAKMREEINELKLMIKKMTEVQDK